MKKLVILAGHDPDLDPRVTWVSQSAAKKYSVTVYGLKDFLRVNPVYERKGGVEIHRLDRASGSNARLLLEYIRFKNPRLAKLFRLVWILPSFMVVLFITVRLATITIYRRFVSSALRAMLYRLRQGPKRLILFLVAVIKQSKATYKKSVPVGTRAVLYRLRQGPKRLILFLVAVIKQPKSTYKRSVPVGTRAVLYRLRQSPKRSVLYLVLRSSGVLQNLLLVWICHHLLRTNAALYRAAIGIGEKIDVIYCNDFDTLISGVLLKSRTGARLVYDAHEFWPYSFTGASKIQIAFCRWLESKFITEADSVLTVNRYMAEEIARCYRLPLVHSLLNAEPWIEDRRPLNDPEIAERSVNRVKFLFLGSFAPQRGLEEFLTAWDRVAPKGGVLFLRGPESPAKDLLRALCATLKTYGQSVFFLPPVPEAELVSAAMDTDVGLIPYKAVNKNYRYCGPNKLSQYLHAGVAILANSDLVFVRQVIEENEVGMLYSVSDIASIERAIVDIIERPDILPSMKKNSLRLAKEMFNWQAQEEKFLGTYLEGTP